MEELGDPASDGSDISVADLSDFDENNNEINDEMDGNGMEFQNREPRGIFREFGGFFEDSDSESDGSEFGGFDNPDVWRRDNFTQPNNRDFSGNGGIAGILPEDARAVEFFKLIWTEEMWQHLVTETNRYATQERTLHPPPPFAAKWTEVDMPTMKAFIGLCFTMGILKLPSKGDYWRTSNKLCQVFKTNFNHIMPRDRYTQIWRYLHLNNRDAQPPAVPDKLGKLRWFITFLNSKFTDLYVPYGYVTIDESMVKFKGRLSFRQYLPSKPIKWGIKIWTLAESTTGYISRFQTYTGKEADQGKGLSHRVVTELMQEFQHKYFRLFIDNFYTGTGLLNELRMRGIYACGTIRSNRKGLPVELLPKNIHLNKHEYRVAQKEDLSFCHWMDTKPVLVLSNFHHPEDLGVVSRRSGQAQQRQVRVPRMLQDYQTHMKGVDLADQMLGYYMIQHRSRKWWRRIFFYLMMASAHNAYILAKDSNPQHAKDEWPHFQDFIEEIVEDLIGDVQAGRAAPDHNQPRPARQHDVRKMYQRGRVCAECRARTAPGIRVGTSQFGCVQCDIPVHQHCVGDHIHRANNA